MINIDEELEIKLEIELFKKRLADPKISESQLLDLEAEVLDLINALTSQLGQSPIPDDILRDLIKQLKDLLDFIRTLQRTPPPSTPALAMP